MSEAISTVETCENNGGGLGQMIISSDCDEECHHPHDFPNGLRVLVIDDNIVCLTVVTALLTSCQYQVTAKLNPAEALMLLKKNKDKFDIVLTDVRMDGVDGFKLLEAGLELDIPVIMMSSSDAKDVIEKGINHGARDYLLKPLRKEELSNIWQHVFRKSLVSHHNLSCTNSIIKENDNDNELENNNNNKVEESSVSKSKKSTVTVDSGSDPHQDNGKRERMKWIQPLHSKFVDAVRSLGGVDKAVPKKIVEIMGVPGVTREQVASHLQKYRKAIKKKEAADTHKQMMMIIRSSNNNNNNTNNNYNNTFRGHHPNNNQHFNNLMVLNNGGWPIPLQVVRPSINPIIVTQPQQVKMELAPGGSLLTSYNFQQQRHR